MAASDNSTFGSRSTRQGGGGTTAPVLPAQPPRVGGIERPQGSSPPAQTAPYPGASTTPGGATAPRRSEAEQRTLIVGREIALSGAITSCDRLVVEGSVQANLANCREIDIAESGLFKGSASIDEAEIRGRFEGTLIARKRLHVRATGKVVATVSYAEIEVETGGQISGEIQVLVPGAEGGKDAVSAASPSAGNGAATATVSRGER